MCDQLERMRVQSWRNSSASAKAVPRDVAVNHVALQGGAPAPKAAAETATVKPDAAAAKPDAVATKEPAGTIPTAAALPASEWQP